MKYHDLPGLGAGIEIDEQASSARPKDTRETLEGFGIERRVVQLALKRCGFGVKKYEMAAAESNEKLCMGLSGCLTPFPASTAVDAR